MQPTTLPELSTLVEAEPQCFFPQLVFVLKVMVPGWSEKLYTFNSFKEFGSGRFREVEVKFAATLRGAICLSRLRTRL